MSHGAIYLLAIGIAALLLMIGLLVTNRGGDWRWLRLPLALGALLYSVVALTTGPWPNGLAVESCSDIVNPALATDASAMPLTIETCAAVPATGAVVLFAAALVLFVVSPELTEFGVPGLLSLKKRLTEQEEKAERLDTRLTHVQTAVATEARVDSKIHNEINVTMDAVRRGQPSELYPAVAESASLNIDAIFTHGRSLAPVDAEFVYYKHVGSGLLRQFDRNEPDVTDFRSGSGATGQAWRDQSTIVVTGLAVHNDEYGLSEEQQGVFADLTVVGATPVYDLDGRTVLGVLTASSTASYAPAADDEVKEGLRGALETTARLLSVALVAYDLNRS